MKISIIVPVYNAEKTIKCCVDSILNQKTESEIEVILVEDYSQDDSYKICCELEKSWEQIKLYRTDGKGVSAARNTGLLHGTGDIIGFCDSDDFYEKNVFYKIEPLFKQEEIDLVIGGFYYSKYKKKQTVIQEEFTYKKEVKVKGLSLFNIILNDYRVLGSVCNKFYRYESIKNMNFSTELDYCEDLFFNAVFVKYNNPKAVIVGFPIYHYVVNKKSATNDSDKLFDEDSKLKYIVSLEKLLDELSDKKCKIYTEYKIVTLAIDFLFHNKAKGKCKDELKKIIKKYNWGFFLGMFPNIPFGSLKWTIKKFIVYFREWVTK